MTARHVEGDYRRAPHLMAHEAGVTYFRPSGGFLNRKARRTEAAKEKDLARTRRAGERFRHA